MALANQGKLVGSDILDMNGMSGKQYRLFINNLIEAIDDARYLEVGSWAGSTLSSAISGNFVKAMAIDNWSQFGGPSKEFMTNVGRFRTPGVKLSFLEQDFRTVDFRHVGKFNVYLFDGPHEEIDQYDGVAMAQPALDDQFVLIVDDWNWPSVRDGTLRAIAELNLDVNVQIEIRTTLDNGHVAEAFQYQKGDWHNGYLIAVLSKNAVA